LFFQEHPYSWWRTIQVSNLQQFLILIPCLNTFSLQESGNFYFNP
jgi:hypothetical protein